METRHLMEIGEKLGLVGKENYVSSFIQSKKWRGLNGKSKEKLPAKMMSRKRLRELLHAKIQLDKMNETCF